MRNGSIAANAIMLNTLVKLPLVDENRDIFHASLPSVCTITLQTAVPVNVNPVLKICTLNRGKRSYTSTRLGELVDKNYPVFVERC